MDVLVFGGSFDPPHAGHLRLLRAALDRLRPDLAYVVPAWRSPLKSASHAPPSERLALVRLALADGLASAERRRIRVEPCEAGHAAPSYTYQTLRLLQRRHPGAKLHFLTGSDALASFSRWRRPAELARACRWLVALRPGARPPSGAGLPPFDRLTGEMPKLSSTEIRTRLLCGEDASGALAERVRARVAARGLYGLAIRRRLRRELSPSRYAHSLNVARRAAELARLHGEDVERAALAGLVHDCGRAIPVARMARFALSRRLRVPLLEETAARAPLLLHAHIGEVLARERHGVRDRAVLGAVRAHTLGAERMSRLDKLLYAADACSADRTYAQAPAILAAARRGVEEGFSAALAAKLDFALRRGAWIHPLGVRLHNRQVEAA